MRDKTLVAWVSPANFDQRGGGVLTLENPGDVFDAVVFGELFVSTAERNAPGGSHPRKRPYYGTPVSTVGVEADCSAGKPRERGWVSLKEADIRLVTPA